MVNYCCVPLCKNHGGFHFPKDKKLRDLWRVAVKKAIPGNKTKLWEPSTHAVVCHSHFKPEDYVQSETLLGEKKRLRKGVIPSIFLERMAASDIETGQRRHMRQERAEKRAKGKQTETETMDISDVHVETEVTIETTTAEASNTDNQISAEISVQCLLLTDKSGQYAIENFRDNPKAIKYYTGFDNFDHFTMFYSLLGPAVDHLNFKCLTVDPKNQLFLTLIKLRQNKEDYELSLFFKISQPTVSIIIATWINFMYFQLKEINIWPDQNVVSQYMPEDFKKKFPSTRVVLDATEVPVKKPSNVIAQNATWSTYKHKNTLKTMIGISPRGLVTFVSDSYGGTASDRQIIERSELCKKQLFNKNDSIMADRGIMVQDLFASKDVKVNTPTMLSGKSQLEPEAVVKDRRIASKRIHVERVIGLAKHFKILKADLPSTKLNMGSRIMFVCFILSNFQSCIVGKLA